MTTSRAASSAENILIIGAGQAGAMAASALRQLGFEGAITLVGEEEVAPYERPPLSKTVLLESGKDDAIYIHPSTHYGENRISTRLGVKVDRLEPQNHRALLTDGSVLHYSKCLLATGGRVRELPQHPLGRSARLHYIRTLADAKTLRSQLHGLAASSTAQDIPLLVLGAGFLGLEVASTALQLGVKSVVLEPGARLLARATPAEFSSWLAQLVQAKGVALRLGVGANGLQEDLHAMHAQLSDGSQLSAACVVAAVGQVANTDLASAAGLAVCAQTGGIVIDAQGRTSAADIYAAGDCTTQLQPLLNQAVRLESWQSANEQARIAAASMLGKQIEPAATPWFWTDMFGLNIQMMGFAHPDLRYCLRGSMPDPKALAQGQAHAKFLLFGLDAQQRLRYALAVNAGGDLRALRPLFTHDTLCSSSHLTDEARSLRDIARQAAAG